MCAGALLGVHWRIICDFVWICLNGKFPQSHFGIPAYQNPLNGLRTKGILKICDSIWFNQGLGITSQKKSETVSWPVLYVAVIVKPGASSGAAFRIAVFAGTKCLQRVRLILRLADWDRSTCCVTTRDLPSWTSQRKKARQHLIKIMFDTHSWIFEPVQPAVAQSWRP